MFNIVLGSVPEYLKHSITLLRGNRYDTRSRNLGKYSSFLSSHFIQLNSTPLLSTVIMNRLTKPERLDLDPSAPNAGKEWRYWRRTFDNFIIECGIDPVPNKHRIITNLISANVYEHVEDCIDFQSVIDTLDTLFVKSPNVTFARHLLSTRRQQSGETLYKFLHDLRQLSKHCKFKAVTAENIVKN